MKVWLALVGGALWATTLTYVLSPRHVRWARVDLPRQVRWLGMAVAFLCTPLLYRVFSSLGTNVTQTVTTRPEHRLVTDGPYRWVRHPLYSTAGLAFLGLSLAAGSWLIGVLTVMALALLARRTRAEERNLEERFGDEYRAYAQTIGRFLPRARRRRASAGSSAAHGERPPARRRCSSRAFG